MSDTNFHSQHNIGIISEMEPPCWCLSSNVKALELNMYGQILSTSATNVNKYFVFDIL